MRYSPNAHQHHVPHATAARPPARPRFLGGPGRPDNREQGQIPTSSRRRTGAFAAPDKALTEPPTRMGEPTRMNLRTWTAHASGVARSSRPGRRSPRDAGTRADTPGRPSPCSDRLRQPPLRSGNRPRRWAGHRSAAARTDRDGCGWSALCLAGSTDPSTPDNRRDRVCGTDAECWGLRRERGRERAWGASVAVPPVVAREWQTRRPIGVVVVSPRLASGRTPWPLHPAGHARCRHGTG
jgi:hypothetical protein